MLDHEKAAPLTPEQTRQNSQAILDDAVEGIDSVVTGYSPASAYMRNPCSLFARKYHSDA